MSGNGALILGMVIIKAHRLMVVFGKREIVAFSLDFLLYAFLLCAAVRGTTTPGGRGRLTATGTSRLTAATAWACGLPGNNPWGLGFGSLAEGFWALDRMIFVGVVD
jgi:hypothetical protein